VFRTRLISGIASLSRGAGLSASTWGRERPLLELRRSALSLNLGTPHVDRTLLGNLRGPVPKPTPPGDYTPLGRRCAFQPPQLAVSFVACSRGCRILPELNLDVIFAVTSLPGDLRGPAPDQRRLAIIFRSGGVAPFEALPICLASRHFCRYRGQMHACFDP
jgi:hypothetical protein